MNTFVFVFWQVPSVIPPSGYDEPHEQIIWILLTGLTALLAAIMSYLAKQLLDRRSYKRDLNDASVKLANPHRERQLNGSSANSAQLLNYVIDDLRETRVDLKELRKEGRDGRKDLRARIDTAQADCAKQIQALRESLTRPRQ